MEYKILIVEDDEDTAVIEATGLQELGFVVEMVHHGDLAIPKMKAWEPDVVILDLELPGKNGYEILQDMFLDSKLRNLIIIANTVHMQGKDELGFSYFTHYKRNKNEDPVMVNKMANDDGNYMDLRATTATMIGKKFGVVPQKTGDWLKRKGLKDAAWSVV